MRTIRTVFQPDATREVEDAEAAQLEREGLLLPLDEPAPETPAAVAPAPKTAVETAPKPTPTPAKEAATDGDQQAQ